MWDCACLVALPSVDDILARVNAHTECTAAQCFDELVPMHAPPSAQQTNLVWIAMSLVMGVAALIMTKSSQSRLAQENKTA